MTPRQHTRPVAGEGAGLRITSSGLALLLAAFSPAHVSAQPEQVVFSAVPSNGVLNTPANSVRQHGFAGGYTLGRIELSGTLTSLHSQTWPSDSRILITAPGGQSAIFQPFFQGGTFTSLPFEQTLLIPAVGDPTGEWTFRFFENFDDGGPGSVDARWEITVRLTDQPPVPPAATGLGVLQDPGTSIEIAGFGGSGAGDVRWYRFSIEAPVHAAAGWYLDFDTVGSTLTGAPPDDTMIALYDESGELIATDDDSGSGFTSQLTFGAGRRPAVGEGLPYDGRHGGLAPGAYYLALTGHPATFGPIQWAVASTAARTGTLQLNIGTNLGGAPVCYANCDSSTIAPVLNVDDFTCFINRYAEGQGLSHGEQVYHHANCDQSTIAPVLNVDDFTCFINAFASGCP